MLYVQQSLGSDEEIVQFGHFHWWYTFEAFMAIFWGMVGSIVVIVGAVIMYKQLNHLPHDIGWIEAIPYIHPGLRIFSFLVFVMGLLTFAQRMVIKATTEIAITNQRLIYKTGLVARHVGEISVNRIEGVNVLQSIFGRMLNFGRLAVRGMGVGEVVLPPIEDPLRFRRAIEEARNL